MKHRISAFIALGIMLAAGTAWAHHSFSPFDMDKRVTLTGILTKVDWRNPHIEISIDVKGDQGQVESWLMEGGPPARFKNYGINKDSFGKAVGQIVTVVAGLAKDGARHGHMQTITFPDGTTTAAR